MRILHITPELPYAPGGSGGSTRQFHLLRRLRARGHDVTVVSPVHHTQREGAGRLADAGIRLAGARRPPSRVRETLGALARRPALIPAVAREPLLAWQVDVFWTSLRRLVEREIALARPDAITVEHDWAAAWHRALPAGVPRALTLQNLSWGYYEARARAAGGAASAALRLEAARFRRFDARHLDAYDLLISVSELDRHGAAAVSRTRCVTIANGVDVRGWESAPSNGDPVVLFTGTMSYPPNAEGLEWLLREIWPRVHARCPDARLRVVGRDPPLSAAALAGPEVDLTGWVADIRPEFAAATLIVVPIRSGGGTRLKVLDGLAAGRAMVSTSAGAEGIDVRDGEHVVIADDADAFAGSVAALLSDPARRSRLAAAGRALAERSYDWDALGDRLDAELQWMVAS